MQTFLPSASFAGSAAALDTARLGKQRVETLQILRAITVPTYGWQRHPAVGMWRGHVPALTAYGLATVQEWRGRGFADGTAEQLLEFAPQVGGRSQQQLAADGLLPDWLGDAALHESHRSKLIDKDPAHYLPLFPGTRRGLEYVWPEGPAVAEPQAAEGLWVLRVAALAPWREIGLLGLTASGPRGRTGPAWREQLRAFGEELQPGSPIGVLADDDPGRLHLAEVVGPAAQADVQGAEHVAVAVRFSGLALERAALPVPALLQNPRRFFRLALPRPVAALVGRAEDSLR